MPTSAMVEEVRGTGILPLLIFLTHQASGEFPPQVGSPDRRLCSLRVQGHSERAHCTGHRYRQQAVSL